MRGEVEIWSGDKLLHKESNLLVNGAGGLIADIMTVSPSLSGIEDHATSSILDASNYTIQAISFGKDASAYQNNAHALYPRRNLWKWSTVSSLDLDNISSSYPNDCIVSSCPDVTPPPGFEDVPSSLAHVVAWVDNSNSKNVTVMQSIYMNNAAGDGPSESNPNLSLSCGQDEWFCRSTYVKLQVPDYPMYHPTDIPYQTIHYKAQIEGEGNVYTIHGTGYESGVGRSRSATNPRYDTTATEFSAVGFSFTDDNRRDNTTWQGGYSIDNWDQNGGVIPVGNGWYRIWTSLLSPVSGVSAILCPTYPAGHEALVPAGEPSGGIYAFGEQLELGRWPTSLQINNNFSANLWDFSGNVLNRDNKGPVTDNGTIRVLGDAGTSSYTPVNFISSPPNPDSTRVEDGNTDSFGPSSVTSGFNMGQNLNVVPYRAQYDQLPGITFYVGYDYMDNGSTLKDETSVPSGTYSFGPQAYYLGCYPEGSSTGGSNWAIVSSLDTSTGYADPYIPIASCTSLSIFNEASSMDVSGFVNMVMSGSPHVLPYTYEMSSTASGLCVSGGLAGHSGVVEYSVLIGSGDVGYSNFYGGIYNMGLWTIDMDKTLKGGNSPPYSFGPLNNPRKYRLFATKHLTKNLGYINDYDGEGVDAGSWNYKDLTIKWRLHFL